MQTTDQHSPPSVVDDSWKTKPARIVVDALAGVAPGRVLDIGAASGRTALYLARQGWEVTALDTDPAMVAALQDAASAESLPVTVLLQDVRKYMPESSFDVLLCLMVLHFLPEADIAPTIAKLQQWTKPGGVNIVSGFTTDNRADARPYLFPPDSLREYYRGWEIKHYEEEYTGWVMPEGKSEAERYMAGRLVAGKPPIEKESNK